MIGKTLVLSAVVAVSVRVAALNCLSALLALILVACSTDPGYQGRPSEEWIRQLSDTNRIQRERAATALGHVLDIQPNSTKVVDALVKALRDTADEVQEAAALALSSSQVRGEVAIPALIKLLSDSAHSHAREHGASIIGEFGPRAAIAVPHLIRNLEDPVASVRAAAVVALDRIGPQAAGAVEALARRARDPNPYVRVKAIQALTRLRPPLGLIIPLLDTALRDDGADVRAAAAYALADRIRNANGVTLPDSSAAIIETAVLPNLVGAVSDEAAEVRRAALTALRELGPRAASALPVVRRARSDADPTVRAAATSATASLEGRPQPLDLDVHPRRVAPKGSPQ